MIDDDVLFCEVGRLRDYLRLGRMRVYLINRLDPFQKQKTEVLEGGWILID